MTGFAGRVRGIEGRGELHGGHEEEDAGGRMGGRVGGGRKGEGEGGGGDERE